MTNKRTLAYLDLIADCLVALAWDVSPDAGARRSRLDALRDRPKTTEVPTVTLGPRCTCLDLNTSATCPVHNMTYTGNVS